VLEHRRREVPHFGVTEHPAQPGHPSRSSRPSAIAMHRVISSGTGIASTAAKSDCGSRLYILKRCSRRPGDLGRIHTPDA
jgi:hypothetical protein